MSWEINSFTSDSLLVEKLATEISSNLEAAIVSRGQATLAVSGGKTPLALFDRYPMGKGDRYVSRRTVG